MNTRTVSIIAVFEFVSRIRRNEKITINELHVASESVTIADHINFDFVVQKNSIKMFFLDLDDYFLSDNAELAFDRSLRWVRAVVEHVDRHADHYWFFVFDVWSVNVEDFSFFDCLKFLNFLNFAKTTLILSFWFRFEQFEKIWSIFWQTWQIRLKWSLRFHFFSLTFFWFFSFFELFLKNFLFWSFLSCLFS